MNKKNYRMDFKFKQEADAADFYFYDTIGSDWWDDEEKITTANGFKAALGTLGEDISLNIYINSLGGDVQDGLAIYSMLVRHKGTVNIYVDAWACSIASVIAMAGDNIYMHSGSKLMIHNASTFGWGNAAEFRKLADELDSISESALDIYTNKSGGKLSRNKFKEFMDAEKWLSADECVKYGLCTEIFDKADKSNDMKLLEDMNAKAKCENFVTRDEVLTLIKQHAFSWEDVEKANKSTEKTDEENKVTEAEKSEDKTTKKKKSKQCFETFAEAFGKMM